MTLVCNECGVMSEDGEGWKAALRLFPYRNGGAARGRGLLPGVLVA